MILQPLLELERGLLSSPFRVQDLFQWLLNEYPFFLQGVKDWLEKIRVTHMGPIPIIKKRILINLLKKTGWSILVLLMLFLPFQYSLSQWPKLDKILWVDEFVVIVMLFLFIMPFLYLGKMSKDGAKILLCLLILGFVGLISGLLNNNPLVVTAMGIFDYLKNFLVIPIFTLLSINRKSMDSLYIMLHRLALFLCLVAFAQEVAFLAGLPIQEVGVLFQDFRFGLLRTPSLMGHPLAFGLYALLFFVLDFSVHRRIRWQNIILVSGVFLSLSRVVWASFLTALLLMLIQNRSKKIVALFIFAVLTITLSIPFFYVHTSREMISEDYFRGYALRKSQEIWKDHPVLGVGPGMYGGVISFIFDSPIYKKYDFSQFWLNYLSGFRSIDQFWPRILSEMGITGTVVFLFLLWLMWRIPQRASLTKHDLFQQRILSGLSVVSASLFIFLFGSGLNLTAFLLTFNILLGMYLGTKNESSTC